VIVVTITDKISLGITPFLKLASINAKRAATDGKIGNCPLCWVKLLRMLFPALQSVLLGCERPYT